MTIDLSTIIRGEKLQHDINRKAAKCQLYHLEKLTNRNFLQVSKYYLLIKEEWQNKLSLFILLQEKPTKTSEGQGKNKRCYYESKQKISGFGFNKYDDHKVNYKEMFEELVKERFDEIKNQPMK